MKIAVSINKLVDREDSQVKAFASITMDGMFAVHGIRVMNSQKGLYVGMPSTAYTDKNGAKQYSDTFHAVTKEAREAVNKAVLAAYDKKLAETQTEESEIEEEAEPVPQISY